MNVSTAQQDLSSSSRMHCNHYHTYPAFLSPYFSPTYACAWAASCMYLSHHIIDTVASRMETDSIIPNHVLHAVASRMETNSIPNHVRLSDATFSRLPIPLQAAFQSELLEIKGKGLMLTHQTVAGARLRDALRVYSENGTRQGQLCAGPVERIDVDSEEAAAVMRRLGAPIGGSLGSETGGTVGEEARARRDHGRARTEERRERGERARGTSPGGRVKQVAFGVVEVPRIPGRNILSDA